MFCLGLLISVAAASTPAQSPSPTNVNLTVANHDNQSSDAVLVELMVTMMVLVFFLPVAGVSLYLIFREKKLHPLERIKLASHGSKKPPSGSSVVVSG